MATGLPELPADLQAAYDSAYECAACANTLLQIIVSTRSGDVSIFSPHDAVAAMAELFESLRKAIEAIESVQYELFDATDGPAYLGTDSYVSFHKAAVDFAGALFDEVWKATDRDQFFIFHGERSEEVVLRADVIAANWWKVHQCRNWRFGDAVPQEFFVMLGKEAVRAAMNRQRQSNNSNLANQAATIDKKLYNEKNSEKYVRPMNKCARDVLRRIEISRTDGCKITQKQAISDHIESHKTCEYSASYLQSVLADNRQIVDKSSTA
jgi:hypothetical protein